MHGFIPAPVRSSEWWSEERQSDPFLAAWQVNPTRKIQENAWAAMGNFFSRDRGVSDLPVPTFFSTSTDLLLWIRWVLLYRPFRTFSQGGDDPLRPDLHSDFAELTGMMNADLYGTPETPFSVAEGLERLIALAAGIDTLPDGTDSGDFLQNSSRYFDRPVSLFESFGDFYLSDIVSIHEYLSEYVGKSPEEWCLETGNQSITYTQGRWAMDTEAWQAVSRAVERL
jgi:hypothetical protein